MRDWVGLNCNAMAEATLSTKNQIVIPQEARRALKDETGRQLLLVVRGEDVIIPHKPESFSTAIRGMGRGLYPRGYLKRERRSWD